MNKGDLSSTFPSTRSRSRRQVAADKRWMVLIVDDQPEVHEVTKLVLANLSYGGRPLDLNSAFSAQEAKAFFALHPEVALVLMDVVMETDQAGLSLTRYIRDELGNEDVQIVVRTGQPGFAPEQDVVSRYNINGYYLKTEVTAQKLCTIVIAALRTYEQIKNIRAIKPAYRPTHTNRFADEQRPRLAERLEKALQKDEFTFAARLQARLLDNVIVGVELRPVWPVSSSLSLDLFELSPILDGTKLIVALNQYLLMNAVKWGRRWQGGGERGIKVTTPILADSHDSTSLFASLEYHLQALDVPRELLAVALSEPALIGNIQAHMHFIEKLHDLGVTVSLSDFASAATSILQLSKLPIENLQIPPWVVRNIGSNPEHAVVARSIIALAHTLSKSVTADGISTQEELQFFKWEDCDLGQGDFISKEMSADEIGELLGPRRAHSH